MIFFIDLIMHLDKYLGYLIDYFGFWTYIILFIVVFSETGFFFIPFLPGDSLLFISGAFSALNKINLILVFFIFFIAAILGDTVNYYIGKYFGCFLLKKGNNMFFKKENFDKTHFFYEKHGGKTIVIARFIPIIRTFAPFIAGLCVMNYRKFVFYNITGAFLWIASILIAGYFFGNISFIKNNFVIVIFFIIILSLIPTTISLFKKNNNRKVKR